jgi:hypothetical protein
VISRTYYKIEFLENFASLRLAKQVAVYLSLHEKENL